MVKFSDNVSVYVVGEPIEFTGYADDFAHGISAVQFTLDGGVTWSTYPTEGARAEAGVNWSFSYTPQRPGTYLLRARSVDGDGVPSQLIANFPFTAVRRADLLREYGNFHLRALDGGPLFGAKLFRSAALCNLTTEDKLFIADVLGIRSIYDIRGARESNASPEPYLLHVKTVTLEARDAGRRKDAEKRLVAGVIEQYGAPEERMCHNYRHYALEYPIIGTALRGIASQHAPALVHCTNGKDRAGVLCAVAMRVAGYSKDDIMCEYLRANEVNAKEIEHDRAQLGADMTDKELAILDSFLEARPAYLEAFFREAEDRFGTFDTYVREGLHLTKSHQVHLTELFCRG